MIPSTAIITSQRTPNIWTLFIYLFTFIKGNTGWQWLEIPIFWCYKTYRDRDKFSWVGWFYQVSRLSPGWDELINLEAQQQRGDCSQCRSMLSQFMIRIKTTDCWLRCWELGHVRWCDVRWCEVLIWSNLTNSALPPSQSTYYWSEQDLGIVNTGLCVRKW